MVLAASGAVARSLAAPTVLGAPLASELARHPLALGPGRPLDVGAIALPDLSQALLVAVGWTGVALAVGTPVTLAAPRYAAAIGDDASARPDVAFAAGFLVFFGLLVGSTLPAAIGVALDRPAAIALGVLVAIPGLLAWAVVLVVGTPLGLVAVGDRLRDRFGDRGGDGSGEASPWRSLAVGTLALAPIQLVPILGTVVTIGLATVGSGAVVVRWYGPARSGDMRSGAAAGERSETGVREGDAGGTNAASRDTDVSSRARDAASRDRDGGSPGRDGRDRDRPAGAAGGRRVGGDGPSEGAAGTNPTAPEDDGEGRAADEAFWGFDDADE